MTPALVGIKLWGWRREEAVPGAAALPPADSITPAWLLLLLAPSLPPDGPESPRPVGLALRTNILGMFLLSQAGL